MKGLLITFEGNEGAGKSTQIISLAANLKCKGYPVTLVREPGGTAVGEKIRTIFKDPTLAGQICPMTELLLIQASRAQLMKEVIFPALARGEFVLADRFVDSTYVYQGLLRGLSIEDIHSTMELVTLDRAADLTFYLRVTPEISRARAIERGQADRLEQEADLIERLHEKFDEYFEHPRANQVVIDSTQSREQIQADIYGWLKERFNIA